MGALTDRQFQSYRLVKKGRKAEDDDGTTKHQQYAVGVVSWDGEPLTNATDRLLAELILEQRRTNLLLQMHVGQEVSLSDVA